MRQNYEQERSTRQHVEWRLQTDVSSGSARFLAHLLQLLHRQYMSSSCSWQPCGYSGQLHWLQGSGLLAASSCRVCWAGGSLSPQQLIQHQGTESQHAVCP